MKGSVAGLLVCILTQSALAGLGSTAIAYVGGTEKIEEGLEGSSSIENEKEFVFEYKDQQLVIPYDEINDLEYGEKVGRRVGLAIAVNPLLIFSKKRKHFLTIGWKDEAAKQHAAVFEMGKAIIRSTIATLEARTGKKVDYQDDDARKSGMG
jgi:hypothetical protein